MSEDKAPSPASKVIKLSRLYFTFCHNKLVCLPLKFPLQSSYSRGFTACLCKASPGSAITNGREPRSCLDRVFNSKLGCIATLDSKCMVCMQQPLLKLKTWPKARPVS